MSKSPRPWPVLVISRGDMVHISRANAGGIAKVHTECGRVINSTGYLSATPRQIMESDGKTIVMYNRWTYKFCRSCADKQGFADAQAEYEEKAGAQREKEEALREAKRDAVSKLQCAMRATIISTLLPEGAEDVESEGWGITFTHNGTPFELKPTDEECYRLYEVAEESACHSE